MASPSVTYTFAPGTTAASAQVNQNFTDLVNALTNGALDLTINSLSITDTLAVLGNVTFGNSAPNDTITFTSRVASVFVPSTTNTYDLGTSALLWKDIYLSGNAFVGGYVEIPLGLKALPSIRGTTTSGNSGFYFHDVDQPAISAGAICVFRLRADGQVELGVGADDDDHTTGTANTDFNYRGQSIRCASNTTSIVKISSHQYAAGATSDAAVEAKVEGTGDCYFQLNRAGVDFYVMGIDYDDDRSFVFSQGQTLEAGFHTVRMRLDRSTTSWEFGSTGAQIATHKFVGASTRVETDHATLGPTFQVRSLRTAVGAGESIGGFEFYSSDTGSAGIQADIRAIETGGSGVNYYLSFRAGASAVLTEGLRLLETGRALFVNGSTAAPAIAAISDTNSGIQFGGSDDMYLVVGGVEKITILAASVRYHQQLLSAVSGTIGAPDISHASDSNTGIAFGQVDDLYLVAGAASRMVVNSTGVGFNGATPIAPPDYTVTNPTVLRSIDASSSPIATVRQVLGTLIEDLISYGLLQ